MVSFLSEKKQRGMIYGLFFLLMLVGLAFTTLLFGDDKVVNSHYEGKSLLESVIFGYGYGKDLFCRYLYSAMYAFVHQLNNGIWWRPLIAASYVAVAYTFERVSQANDHGLTDTILAISCSFLIPIAILSETGWLSTPIVYITPAAFAGFAMIGVLRVYKDSRVNPFIYVLNLIILYIGAGHEQLSALLLGMITVLCLIELYEKRVNFYMLGFWILSAIQTWRAVTWPANVGRRWRETRQFFPDYFSLNAIDKMYLGFNLTMRGVMRDYPIQLLLLSIILMIIIWNKYDDELYRFLGVIPVIVILIAGNILECSRFFGLSRMFDVVLSVNNYNSISGYICVFVCVCIIGNIVINLFLAIDGTKRFIILGSLFLGGLCTRFIMGMSASIYASGNRTAVILYLCIMLLVYSLRIELKKYSAKVIYKVYTFGIPLLATINYADYLLSMIKT